MRFSDERIRTLAYRMAKRMIDEGVVDPAVRTQNLTTLIANAIEADLRMEDEIDAEARERVSKYRNLPPAGTPEHEAAFEKEKRFVAQRRGYPL